MRTIRFVSFAALVLGFTTSASAGFTDVSNSLGSGYDSMISSDRYSISLDYFISPGDHYEGIVTSSFWSSAGLPPEQSEAERLQVSDCLYTGKDWWATGSTIMTVRWQMAQFNQRTWDDQFSYGFYSIITDLSNNLLYYAEDGDVVRLNELIAAQNNAFPTDRGTVSFWDIPFQVQPEEVPAGPLAAVPTPPSLALAVLSGLGGLGWFFKNQRALHAGRRIRRHQSR